MTLSSFHHAGISSAASLGVPRVKEIISLSRNLKTPEIKIIFDKKTSKNPIMVNKIASHLSLVTLKDIRKKIDFYYDPNPLKKDGWMAKDNVYNIFYSHSQSKYACQKNVNDTICLLRIEINREKMFALGITLLDIKSKFCNNWEKRYNDIKNLKKEDKIILDRITTVCILSNSDNDLVPVIHIRFNMTQFDFAILTKFIDSFVDDFKLKGIEHIEKITGIAEEPYVSFNEEGTLLKEKHWVVYTSGVNMRELRYINGIDLNKTLCNDIMTIYDLYGIDV
jgi:DNA-directed RNA polymerase II subunit RPB1